MPAATEPLPPLDSLGADSDYTAFLRQEVAPELRAQALRRAWTSDPAIAGFRGMAEYDWDFNAPGYGALSPADIAQAVADLAEAMAPSEPAERMSDSVPSDERTPPAASTPEDLDS
jgi:hypothetical protein